MGIHGTRLRTIRHGYLLGTLDNRSASESPRRPTSNETRGRHWCDRSPDFLAAVASATLIGAVGRAVSVEVHVSNGLPGFTTVGLPGAAVCEARDRVHAAILSTGLPGPMRRITANFAPASSENVRQMEPVVVGQLRSKWA